MHIEELRGLDSFTNTIRMTKLRRMRLTGHVACMGKGQVHNGFQCGTLNKGHLLDLGGRWEDDIKMDNQEIGWGTRWRQGSGWCAHGNEI